MIRLSSLIGKPIICLASSCISGKVADVYFDEYCKKAAYFCISQEGDGACLLLPFAEAQSIADAVVIADEAELSALADTDTTVLRCGVLGMAVYAQNGVKRGTVRDVVISPTAKVMKISSENGDFNSAAVAAVGNVILLKTASKAKQNTAKGKINIPRPDREYPVCILNGEQKSAAAVGEEAAQGSDGNIGSAENTEENTALQTEDGTLLAMQNYVNNTSAQNSAAANTYAPSEVCAADVKNIQTSFAVNAASAADLPMQTSLGGMRQGASLLLQSAAYALPTDHSSPKPPISMSADSREPVLTNGAFQMILDGSAAYSYDEDAHTPTRVICDYEFLLGRTLGADLRTYTGEIIAAKGSAVTDETVDRARRAGKLVELTLNSVKAEK